MVPGSFRFLRIHPGYPGIVSPDGSPGKYLITPHDIERTTDQSRIGSLEWNKGAIDTIFRDQCAHPAILLEKDPGYSFYRYGQRNQIEIF